MSDLSSMYKPVLYAVPWYRRLFPSLSYALHIWSRAALHPGSNYTPSREIFKNPTFTIEFFSSPRRAMSGKDEKKRVRTNSDSIAGNVDKSRRKSKSAEPSSSSSRRSADRTVNNRVDGWINRKWITGQNLPPARPHTTLDFSVMSYNILSQDLLEDNEHLYYRAREENLEWSVRRRRIFKEIMQYSPDVLCLQEAQKDHFEKTILPRFQFLGYQGIYKKRTNDKPDGCALLYKESKFILKDYTLVEYQMGKHALLDRDNVAIVAILETITPIPAKVCISTTHLLFNHKRGDVKLAQCCVLLAEIDKLTKKYLDTETTKIPVIMTGDFNSTPYSPLYNFILHSYLHYEGLYSGDIAGPSDSYGRYLPRGLLPPPGLDPKCQFDPTPQSTPRSDISHGFTFLSAYTHVTQRRGRNHREITTHHGRAETCVDYIFYTIASKQSSMASGGIFFPVDIVEDKLRLLERLDLLTGREAQESGCFPNEQFGSDHLSLMCKFRLILPEKTKKEKP